MAKNKMISLKQVNNAKFNNKNILNSQIVQRVQDIFIDWLLPKVKSYVGEINKDLIVRTTLDVKLQKIAEESLINVNSKFDSPD